MKLRIDRDALNDAVATVARTLPARPPVPVLAGVLLEATEDTLTVSGFDYETSTRITTRADTHTDGQVLVSGKLLASIAQNLPKNTPVTLTAEGTKLLVEAKAARFSLPTMAVEDYPSLPAQPAGTGTIEAGRFIDAISQVAVAAGKDDTLPMLTGIRVEITGRRMTLAATDRFRLAVRDLNWEPNDPAVKINALVPAKTLAGLVKPTDPSVRLDLALDGSGLLGVHTEGNSSTARLLEAEFPKFRQLLPAEHSAMATVNVQDLVAAVKRASLVAERGAQVRLTWTDSSVSVSAGGDDLGRSEETIDAHFVGEPLVIAFNPQYLLDGLAGLGSRVVQFGFTAANRPAVLRPLDELPDAGTVGPFAAPETDYRYLLMPVRIPS